MPRDSDCTSSETDAPAVSEMEIWGTGLTPVVLNTEDVFVIAHTAQPQVLQKLIFVATCRPKAELQVPGLSMGSRDGPALLGVKAF